MWFARIALCLAMAVMPAGCFDGTIAVPPLRADSYAEFDIEGRLVTAFNGYGDPDAVAADGSLLKLVVAPSVATFTSWGFVDAVRFSYALLEGAEATQLGADYIQETRGQVAYVSHRSAPQEAGSQNQHAWDTGLPDAMLSTLFAGHVVHAGPGSARLATAPWREYDSFRTQGLEYRVELHDGAAHVFIETDMPPLSARVNTWTVTFDGNCPFPSSVVVDTRDGTPGMRLERRLCEPGTGEVLRFGFDEDDPGPNPRLRQESLAATPSGIDGLTIREFSAREARLSVEASGGFSDSCPTACRLLAARYTEAQIPSPVPILMEPKDAQQWGFWYQGRETVRHFVAERTIDGLAIREGRDAERVQPIGPAESEGQFLGTDEIVPSALAAIQVERPRVFWRVVSPGDAEGRLLQIDGGIYDQTNREGAVRAPSAGLTLSWASARGGHLYEYIGRLDVDPED